MCNRGKTPLLETLTQDIDKKIADADAKVMVSFKEAIESTREWEARESRDRDERFEWQRLNEALSRLSV